MINRLFSTLLVIVVSAIASQSSNAQTFTVPIAQADGTRASLTVEAQSLSLNLETRAEIPFSDFSIGASVGTSGLSFLIIEDEYIYRSMKVDEDGDFIDSPTTGATRSGEKGCRTPTSQPDNPDITPGGDGNVGPDITGDDGLSVYDKEIEPRTKKEKVGKVKVSDLPDGLGLSDPDENGHQHVIPTTEMSFEDFQEKLNDIPWEKHENGSGGGNGGGGGSGGTVE
jgi:hypothetical protein